MKETNTVLGAGSRGAMGVKPAAKISEETGTPARDGAIVSTGGMGCASGSDDRP